MAAEVLNSTFLSQDGGSPTLANFNTNVGVAGECQLIVVATMVDDTTAPLFVDSVQFGSTGLTRLGSIADNTNLYDTNLEVWSTINPPRTSGPISLAIGTGNDDGTMIVNAYIVSGVKDVDPLRVFDSEGSQSSIVTSITPTFNNSLIVSSMLCSDNRTTTSSDLIFGSLVFNSTRDLGLASASAIGPNPAAQHTVSYNMAGVEEDLLTVIMAFEAVTFTQRAGIMAAL